MEVLPSELVRECLLRVPYKAHGKLKVVCKTWKAIVSSPTFYEDRKISGKSQQLIAWLITYWSMDRVNFGPVYEIMVYDPLKGTSERLPPIDDPDCPGLPAWCQCAAVNRKLLIIGGSHPINNNLMNSVYIYDFETARWSRGADMPTRRSSFACCASPSTGLVYVAGGFSELRNPLAAAEAYNVEEDRWEILPPMIQQRGEGCQAVFFEGKIVVFQFGAGGHALDTSAEVFDPTAGTWSRWENIWRFGGGLVRNSGAVAAFSGDLYVFIQRSVMKYDRQKNVWSVVASFPQDSLFACATQWRDWIFVSGSHVTTMFNPSTGQFKGYDGVGGGQGFSATTVEI